MTVILVHGVGNNNPGWSDALKADELLGVPKADIVEFNYEDLMEKNWINRLFVLGARGVATYYATPAAGFAANYIQDFVNDILMYFIAPSVRKKILERFSTILAKYPDAVIIGLSLGSIVAYEAIKRYPRIGGFPTLITVGSPLGSPTLEELVKKFLLTQDKSRPLVRNWFNFYSARDPLSGLIEELGCAGEDQFKTRSSHKFEPYLRNVQKTLPSLFS